MRKRTVVLSASLLVSGCLKGPPFLSSEGGTVTHHRNAVPPSEPQPASEAPAENPTVSGVVALGVELIVELRASLLASGLSQAQVDAIAASADAEVRAGAVAISTAEGALRLTGPYDPRVTPVAFAAPLVIKGAVKALGRSDVGFGDGEERAPVLTPILGSTFRSLKGRIDALDPSAVEALSSDMVGAAVRTLPSAGLNDDAAATAGAAIASGAVGALRDAAPRGETLRGALSALVASGSRSLAGIDLASESLSKAVSSFSKAAVESIDKTGLGVDARIDAVGDIAAAAVGGLREARLKKSTVRDAVEHITAASTAGLAGGKLAASKTLAAAVHAIAAGAVKGFGADGAKAAAPAAAGAVAGILEFAPADVASEAVKGAVGGILQSVAATSSTLEAGVDVLASVVGAGVSTLGKVGAKASLKDTLLASLVSASVDGFQVLSIQTADAAGSALTAISKSASSALAEAGYGAAAVEAAASLVVQTAVASLDRLSLEDTSAATALPTLVAGIVDGVKQGLDTLSESGAIDSAAIASASTSAAASASTAAEKLVLFEQLPSDERETVLASIADKVAPRLVVTGRSPFVVGPGERVTLVGSAFRATMTVAFRGVKVAGVDVASDVSASFLAPSDAAFGLADVEVAQDGAAQTISLFVGGAPDFPISTKPASEICSGEKFYDASGVLTEGTRACSPPPDCASDGATGCVTTSAFRAADAAVAIPGNIRLGATVAGVAGAVVPSAADCASDGEVGCVSTSTFPAVDKVNVLQANAAKIRSSLAIAGVGGALADCASSGAQGCYAAGAYKAATACSANGSNCYLPSYAPTSQPLQAIDYDAVDPAKMLTTQTVSGKTGTIAVQGAWNLTSAFPGAGYYSGVTNTPTAGVIKKTVSVLGVTGDYPSAGNPLANADGTDDLDLATFDAKIKSSSSFEWFDSTGARYTNSGDDDIVAANIVGTVSIFGTAGAVNSCVGDGLTGCITTGRYRSMDTDSSVISAWDIRAGRTAGGIAGNLDFFKSLIASFDRTAGDGAAAGPDSYDTVDDYNNNSTVPTTAVNGWPTSLTAGWLREPTSDTDSDGQCDAGEDCVLIDRIANLHWMKYDGTARLWEDAITHCVNSTYGSFSDWRLPTIKEMMQASINGIRTQTALNLSPSLMYSSTTRADVAANAWSMAIGGLGNTGSSIKSSTSLSNTCVRP